MSMIRFGRSAAAFLGVIAISACSESTPPDTEVPAPDVQTALNEMRATQTYAGMGMSSAPIVIRGNPGDPTTCPFDPASAFFVCTPMTSNGVTFRLKYQLLDANGTPQSAINPSTTSAIRVVTDMNGTMRGDGDMSDITLSHHGDQTMSGLRTATRVINGTSTMHEALSYQGTPFVADIAEKIEGLVGPAPGSANPYPRAGKITEDIRVTSGNDTQTVHMTMTFNGTSLVTVTMTSGGITQTCTVDLAHPEQIPSCS